MVSVGPKTASKVVFETDSLSVLGKVPIKLSLFDMFSNPPPNLIYD